MYSLVGIYREEIFSPGKIKEDAAILDATLARLSNLASNVFALHAEALEPLPLSSIFVLSMAQSERALNVLEEWQKKGIRIINSINSVRNCYRRSLTPILEEAGVLMPFSRIIPLEEVETRISFDSKKVYWLKRGDVHAIQSADVVKVASGENLAIALQHFHRQKVGEILVQEHIEGQVIKFYGVGGGAYFSAYRAPSGEKITLPPKELPMMAEQAAEAVGLEIYGGDVIYTPEGRIVLIDLNDWPSFSPCCQAAADGIAKYVNAFS